MKNFFKAIILVLFFASTSSQVSAAPPLSIIKKAKDMVERVRYELPAEISPYMLLTQLSYDSKTYTLVYRYHCTVPVTKPTPESIKEAKLGVIHMLKANPQSEDMLFVKSGISFHYNYYSEDGKFLYAVKITPADIK